MLKYFVTYDASRTMVFLLRGIHLHTTGMLVMEGRCVREDEGVCWMLFFFFFFKNVLPPLRLILVASKAPCVCD